MLDFERSIINPKVLKQREGDVGQSVDREVQVVVRDAGQRQLQWCLAERCQWNQSFNKPSNASRKTTIMSNFASNEDSRSEPQDGAGLVDLNATA